MPYTYHLDPASTSPSSAVAAAAARVAPTHDAGSRRWYPWPLRGPSLPDLPPPGSSQTATGNRGLALKLFILEVKYGAIFGGMDWCLIIEAAHGFPIDFFPWLSHRFFRLKEIMGQNSRPSAYAKDGTEISASQAPHYQTLPPPPLPRRIGKCCCMTDTGTNRELDPLVETPQESMAGI